MKRKLLGYMHLLDGEPASFDPNYGGYLHYASYSGPTLVKDLRTLRRQQAHDAKSNPSYVARDYGYARVYAAQKVGG